MLAMHAVAAHWGELPPREQQILMMDFRGGMTRAQIGQRLHISQMHVSRLRGRALGHLRSRPLGPEPHAAPIPARRQHPGRHTTTTGSNRLPAGPRSADTLPGRHQRPARRTPWPARERRQVSGVVSRLVKSGGEASSLPATSGEYTEVSSD
jgi:hypothetical protein